jgi:hypothetical protein
MFGSQNKKAAAFACFAGDSTNGAQSAPAAAAFRIQTPRLLPREASEEDHKAVQGRFGVFP